MSALPRCGREAVQSGYPRDEFRLPSIAWMPDASCCDPEIIKPYLGVSTNRHNKLRGERTQKPHCRVAARLSLRSRMAPVGHGSASFMGMKREDVPKKHRTAKSCQFVPYDARRSLSHRGPVSGARKHTAPQSRCVTRKVRLIGQRKPSPPSAAITEVTSHPDRVYAAVDRCTKDEF